MAFPSTGWYKKLFEDALENTAAIDLNTDTIKAALFTNSVDGSTIHSYDTVLGYNVAPWTSNEIPNATGYTTGGATLTNPAVTVSGGIKFDADDASWTTATFSGVRGVLVYRDFTGTSEDYGIVAVNFTADYAVVAGTFTVAWNAAGILTIT